MILRDPPMLHLLLHETCRTLEATVWNEMVPKKEERLKHLTSLLAVACGARVSTRADRPVLPQPPPAVMSEFYPILAEMILEAMLRAGRGDEEETEDWALGDDKLRDMVKRLEDDIDDEVDEVTIGGFQE